MLVALERGKLRLLFIAFDLMASDLPLRVAFPILFHNTIEWFQPQRVEFPPITCRRERHSCCVCRWAIVICRSRPLRGKRAIESRYQSPGFYRYLGSGSLQLQKRKPRGALRESISLTKANRRSLRA